MPFGWVLFILVFVGGSFIWRQRQMAGLAQAEKNDSHARAGEVAARMGLCVVEGNPEFNFFHTGRWQDLGQAMSKNVLVRPDRPDIVVHLQGSPGGRAVEVHYFDRLRVKDNITSREVHRTFDARLVVGVLAPFPDFEVHSRNPNDYARPKPELALPPVSFGDPMLDSALVLKSADARVAPAIAEGMRALASEWYVHVIGQGGKLTFRFVEHSATLLGQGDKFLLALDQVARGLEQAASAHVK